MSIGEYHKIPGIWARSSERPHPILHGTYRSEEVALLKDCPWQWTEKVDGTNIRVIWDGHKPKFAGRTDKAQLHPDLITTLQETFTEEILEQTFESREVVLYGEGYGAGIQRGGEYRPDKGFILFDIKVGFTWLKQEDVWDISNQLGCDVVPIIYEHHTLTEVLEDMSKNGFPPSFLKAEGLPEGIVGRPVGDFLGRRGNRIIVKIKPEDIKVPQRF